MIKSYTHYIYTISDNGKPIYVGRTDNIKRRLWMHRSNGSIFREGLLSGQYQFEILDEVDIKDVLQFEKYWISQFTQWGFNLLNINVTNTQYLKFKPSI